MIILTKHAEERRKRLGLSKKALQRLANIAFEKGIKHEDTNGKFKKLFDSLYFNGKHANNIRVYGEHIFVFMDKTLITVIGLKNNFKKYI